VVRSIEAHALEEVDLERALHPPQVRRTDTAVAAFGRAGAEAGREQAREDPVGPLGEHGVAHARVSAVPRDA
jgi:hypothetical protein